jgi:hypothetical protein
MIYLTASASLSTFMYHLMFLNNTSTAIYEIEDGRQKREIMLIMTSHSFMSGGL